METFAAGDTGLRFDGLDVGLKTLIDQVKDMRARDLDTRLNAAHTHDTPIHPLTNQGSPEGNIGPLKPFTNIVLFVDPELIREILKLALPSGIADRAVQGMLNEQELQSIPPHLLHPFCPCVNHHPLQGRGCASGYRLFYTLNVNQAHPAGLEPTQLGQITETGNIDTVFSGPFQNRCVISDRNLRPINR
jgi:hypothetical protein